MVYNGACEAAPVDGQKRVEIDLSAIKQIESSGNPRAYNKRSGATGAFQLTQPVIDDWNRLQKPPAKVMLNDMYDELRAAQLASWYLHERIPQMLQVYKLPVNEENVLAAYNAGIGRMRKRPWPAETDQYVKKYRKAILSKPRV
jgi:soluble lytic murein transglycosylase-like protein